MLAWLLTGGALIGMYPWARLLLHQARRESDWLLTAVVTVALSVGMLSLLLCWLGLSGARIDWRTATALYALVIVIGVWRWLVISRADSSLAPIRLLPERGGLLVRVALTAIGVIMVLILFNALYWPFGVDDAVAIYGFYGKQIALTGSLPPLTHGSLYEAYPMAIPLWFAYTHQAAGWIDEHLAALIPALLSLGTIPVAYLIGRELYDRATGLIAALLIALTPTIAYWASASYVDLPAGFFYGLAILFAVRHYRRRGWQDALLTGLMAGLAAWTKNSALLIVGVLFLWIVYSAWRARYELPRPLARRDVLLIAAGFLAVCAPWYARDWLLAGVIVPPTGWTFAADRSTANLLPYFVDPRYWPTGLLFTIGMWLSVKRAWQARARELASAGLLIGYAPFFVIWWALFSYEDRFLLVLTPLIAVMGARVVRDVTELLFEPEQLLTLFRPLLRFVGPRPIRGFVSSITLSRLAQPRRLTLALVGLIVLCTLLAANNAVLYKNELLRRPFMADSDKQRIRLGARYDVGLYLQSLPVGSHILSDDTYLPYLSYPALVTVGGGPASADELRAYQYFTLQPNEALPAWYTTLMPAAALPVIVYQSGGYRLYALQSTP